MKKIWGLLILGVFLFTTVACSNETSSEEMKVFATFASADGFRETITDGMKSYASSNNINLDIEIANDIVETQVQQVKEAKNKDYDVIVCLLVDSDTAQQIINEAGDIPIVFVSVEPDESRLKEDKYIYVASNEDEVVNYSVEYLSDYFKDNKSFDAVILEGNRNQKSAIRRTDYLKSQLKKKGFDINYVFQDSAKWDKERAKKVFKTFLNLNKSYDCVICNNDEMAMGVLDVMKEEGIDPSKIPILGVDAISEACTAILNGDMAFSIKQSGEGQGESAMKAAQILNSGGRIKDLEYADENGKYIWYPYSKVDKSNAASYINQRKKGIK